MTVASIPTWTWADRVRKVRRSQGLTQAEFAQKLGVGGSVIGQWELGNHEPRDVVGAARRIEAAFGVPAAWMLGLTDSSPRPAGPGAEKAISSGCKSVVIHPTFGTARQRVWRVAGLRSVS